MFSWPMSLPKRPLLEAFAFHKVQGPEQKAGSSPSPHDPQIVGAFQVGALTNHTRCISYLRPHKKLPQMWQLKTTPICFTHSSVGQ